VSSFEATNVVDGWRLRNATSPRGLPGANGLRWGPDGLLYNASAYGSTLSRVDVDTGELEILSSQRPDESVTPDDLALSEPPAHPAIMPPSITSTAPVTNDASSDAR
jgi:hypothetical protein